MKRHNWMMRAGLAALLVLGVACSKDGTGPGGVTFPPLPSDLLAGFCSRGEAVAGQTKSGSVTASDCDAGDSYYEVWRVRVASPASVTFDATSGLDNYLTIARLESYTSTSETVTIVGENDDRSTSDLNALVTVTLQPNTDYFVSVSGYDYSQTGSYTLRIR